ncbi:MarR family winged helix-turn-helix transcriptional regulator [Mucilaginibacter phyllosphaerae]|uniref:MarR family transcriptional regulator n=1 Tax=Mucilaginibacter phyllosphaerae TaxID=1812349 RepID=A0A4Y8AIG5_9SPHI|nr:MarR family winged helix-turn-helix transcriptional regulator [Mucilaginibacter phyllosphaerae]MBB3968116.1 DNA-binding MarR family transcriptional regulator [Mucilaginibacter phyllosphaerae]TEW68863.1 MarR family transcriptional regulator [Mucilaginibacter phyllosphaerae]GGH01143.1 hypothetical protein GCM10007352_02730 [Mucilaginibacter phyllosphaerae]
MKSYQLIHQLISLVEKLEEEKNENELSLNDFAGYLLTQITQTTDANAANDTRFGGQETPSHDIAYQLDNSIGRLFIYMSRYAKSYIKKALEGTPLQTAEDFTGLAILLTHDNLSKSELINYNLQEKTSGTEVIRRLIAAGLVKQWDNQKDKRGKQIAITDTGRELLYNVFTDMSHVGKMITGNLTASEKFMLHYLLQKLEDFHYDVHRNKTIETKADLQAFHKEPQ